jgi:alkylation response protein AidB-like acyl-CoA dehydrogenase
VLTLEETADEARFRREIRDWAADNIPAEVRWSNEHDDLLRIDKILGSAGLLAAGWPTEYGGRGLPPTMVAILVEELSRAGVQSAKAPSQPGVNNLAPALIAHGTKAQLSFFLPRMLSSEILWCQGFSEPEAGSDLASLRTSARLDGVHWVVNGSKIWTSHADHANWIYALVRTGTQQERHRGISMLVFEMASAGVTIRPILQINGASEFCEVFFDNVLVPQANMIGEVGQGWTVANSVLAPERLSGRYRYAAFRRQYLELASMLAASAQPPRDDQLRDLGRAVAEIEGMAALSKRVESLTNAGQDLGVLPQVNKLWWPRAHQQLTELALNLSTSLRSDPSKWYDLWLDSRSESIYGGTAQIQRDIVSERLLGLPRGRRG